eukprot:TRINITY_DN45485_c0_g1_i1.p1 TRINITY_DN45485_c0_g1~~TRINITY_DN45485_c0_g1_i1.p1  ORF type:complete len:481 (-),score=132.27 TRINITY_DN45485_c0_g1_i1:120-1562(-)
MALLSSPSAASACWSAWLDRSLEQSCLPTSTHPARRVLLARRRPTLPVASPVLARRRAALGQPAPLALLLLCSRWRQRSASGSRQQRWGRQPRAAKKKSAEEVASRAEAERLGIDEVFLKVLNDSKQEELALEEALADVSSMTQKEAAQRAKLLARLSRLSELHNELRSCAQQLEEARELAAAGADELAELAAEEANELEERRQNLADQLQLAMLPKSTEDEAKGAILEIRAAAGGDEASLWAEELMSMYTKYAELEGMRVELLECSRKEGGGISEAQLAISGEEVFSKMKFETGVHRVQRIPATETAGRTHTSTATVAIMPEVEDVDASIDEKDIDFKFCRASGKGGQNVNKVETAVHAVHRPSGFSVFVQQERTQLHNRRIAVRLLAAKLQERELTARNSELSQMRQSQVGTGDRSEKIRTYNYKENRCTDHRLGSNFPLSSVLAGGLQEAVRQLRSIEQQEKLKDMARNLQQAARVT